MKLVSLKIFSELGNFIQSDDIALCVVLLFTLLPQLFVFMTKGKE